MPDFLDRLGDELLRVASTPTAQAAPAPVASRPVRRLRGPARLRRRWLLTALVVLLAGVGAAIATSGRNSPGPVPPRPGAVIASAPDPADLASFGILRRPQAAEDQVPLGLPVALSGASGANLQLARRAPSHGDGQAWVVPGRGSMCLISSWPAEHSGGANCVPDAAARGGELVTESASGSAPGSEFIAGLVPDGVGTVTVQLAGGATLTLTVRENVYIAAISGDVAAVSFVGPRGAVRVEGLGLPGGAG
jgi:hypothetical protein